ncbi:MAG: hypothetical protein JSU64_03740, partial [candidate division WOR-3 bacterium]
DGYGGAIIGWENDEHNNMIYAQKLDQDGNVLWGSNGVLICMTPGKDNHRCRLAPDGSGGAVITWFDGGRTCVHVQRVDANGDTLWQGNGLGCSSSSDEGIYPEIVSDGSGGAIVTWHELTSNGGDIYVQRISAGGDTLWGQNGVAVCALPGDQRYPQIIPYAGSGAIIVWEDRRNPGHGMYAQRLDADGNAVWQPNGVVLCTAVSAKQNIDITPDGSGGAIVTWLDNRDYNKDVYAQRIDAAGDTLWPASAVALCTEPTYQSDPRIASDGSGGAIITWLDIRGTSDAIYAQRVDANGTVRWQVDGVRICSENGYNSSYPRLISDSSSGAIVSWQAASGTAIYGDIYAQRINSDGEPVATLCKGYSVFFDGSRVAITWELAESLEGMRYHVMRRELPDGSYEELFTDSIEDNRLDYVYEDGSVSPGGMYRYRVEIGVRGMRKVLFESEPVSTPSVRLALYQN